jgi:hypothetical protein
LPCNAPLNAHTLKGAIMDIEMLTAFFMWCSIVNIGLLVISFLLWMVASDWIYALQSKWFPMPRQTLNVVFYCLFGFYKIIVYMFNIVPWVVLKIIA